jgi:hypothetical protein
MPQSSRIIALDILRGYFITVIASVHLAYYPSLLGLFDGRGQLWVSEAEGFFFISGLITGIIRHRDLVRHGMRKASEKLFKRGGKLYLASIVLTLLYTAIGRLTTSAGLQGAKGGLDTTSSWVTVVYKSLTLQYGYGWTDFLMYYAAFMVIAPVFLWLLSKGKWWIVVGISLAAWYARWSGEHGQLDAFIQWQAYFYLGMVIGYHWHQIQSYFGRLGQVTRKNIKRLSVGLAVAVYTLSVIFVFTPEYFEGKDLPSGWLGSIVRPIITFSQNYIYSRLLVDGRIGLLRPLVWLTVFAGLYFLVRHYENAILRTIGRILVPLGQNSLYVYIIESLFLFAIPYVLSPGSFLINSLLELLIISSTWLAVRKQFLFRLIPR